MEIELHEVRVRELCADYNDLSIQEEGIVGYGGRLNIRPKYQREFVYDEKQRNAVMDTVWQNFPLNVMYWVKTDGTDGIEYEVLDGQQRTISICSFIAGEYMMNFDGNLLGFNNMTIEQQNRILDYKLQVYICEGTDEEKIKWFQRINKPNAVSPRQAAWLTVSVRTLCQVRPLGRIILRPHSNG